jgi:hypothetical protein
VTDDEILDAVAAVCNFDRAEVDRWRREALIIGRAVERAALERVLTALEDAKKPAAYEVVYRMLKQTAQSGEDQQP